MGNVNNKQSNNLEQARPDLENSILQWLLQKRDYHREATIG